MGGIATRLRRCLRGFRHTPLHPQWFAYLHERERLRWATGLAQGRVLDIGCADRRVEALLAEGCEYLGLDCPTAEGAGYSARPDVYATAERLPFADASFDTVLLMEVLEHLCDPLAALREARRVLHAEGRIIASTPFLYPIHDAPWDFSRWTAHGLDELAELAELDVESRFGRGRPVETGALLLNIALAWQALEAPAWRRLPLLALVGFLVPCVNLLGWTLARLPGLPSSNPMPHGYQIVLRKNDK